MSIYFQKNSLDLSGSKISQTNCSKSFRRAELERIKLCCVTKIRELSTVEEGCMPNLKVYPDSGPHSLLTESARRDKSIFLVHHIFVQHT
ncbi:hypothetical protein CSB45_11900 [candidate division KSB3 bacterium]|uniref:Uncharacterized protein n=1 Tax=candidate division KSB3 bacterium TaxID=2044937 RepID=A0A2G6E2V4_9BACT|nr:MAG: hypothetical protein CSB45_11900 [candidate division KSB3 bacterium]PIE29241.1 MAG: hypothetical protein CSA57_09550 [candidate division KSB3 bacterium]